MISAERRTRHSQRWYSLRILPLPPRCPLWRQNLHLHWHPQVANDGKYPFVMQSRRFRRTPRHPVSRYSGSLCRSAHFVAVIPVIQSGPSNPPTIHDDRQTAEPSMPPPPAAVQGIKRTSSGVRKSTLLPLSSLLFQRLVQTNVRMSLKDPHPLCRPPHRRRHQSPTRRTAPTLRRNDASPAPPTPPR